MSIIRNRLLKTAGSNFIIVPLPETLAGDICFYDKANKTKIFETDYNYDLGAPLKVIQYRLTTAVKKGTLDIM